MSVHAIELTINGQAVSATVEARTSLLDFLREQRNLNGTHSGCEHGVCGTCTIIVDGRSLRACLMLAVQADGSDVETVEGLNRGLAPGELTDLQQAFWDRQALQCGFCTPGMLMRAEEILRANANPTRDEVRLAISSNFCRCTGYEFIIEAILQVAQSRAASDE